MLAGAFCAKQDAEVAANYEAIWRQLLAFGFEPNPASIQKLAVPGSYFYEPGQCLLEPVAGEAHTYRPATVR
jgi:hypothetical protein